MNYKNATKGFTLIEIMVAVLIVGILCSIALPQYTKLVDKARATEVLTIVNTMKNQIDLQRTTYGTASSPQLYDDFANVIYKNKELQGEYEGWVAIKHNNYLAGILNDTIGGFIFVESVEKDSKTRKPIFYLNVFHRSDAIEKGFSSEWAANCYTQKTKRGNYICNYFENNLSNTIGDFLIRDEEYSWETAN